MTPWLLLLAALGAVVLAVVGSVTWTAAAGAHDHTVRRGGGRGARRLDLRARTDRLLRRTDVGRQLEARVVRTGLGWRTLDVALAMVGVVAVAFVVAVLLVPVWAAVLVAVVASRGVLAYVDHRERQRHEAFVQQMPELARVLSNASSAGLSLSTSLAMAAREMAAPAGDEIGRVVDEMRLGAPLDEALGNLEDRIRSREIAVLVNTIIIQHRAGGDVVAALRELAGTLDERRELRREVRTMMAGEIFSGYLVVGMAVGSLLLINLYRPGVLDELLSSVAGIVAVAVSAGFFTAAWVVSRRITSFEV